MGDVDTRLASRPLPTAEDTREWGARLGRLLQAGDLVVLTGGLGAGKTTLTQGIAEGLGVRGPITSPTFVIARVHPSLMDGPDLVHVDAYRLGGFAELDDRSGPARDALVRATEDWVDELAKAVRIAIREGHFRPDTDPEQLAFEIYGIMHSMHVFFRFLRDPASLARTRTAFERLIASVRLARPRQA